MTYQSSSAFRRALEDRLRSQSLQTGEPLVRLRKMVAFDRCLARLVQVWPGAWMLKGGLALQLRLGIGTRTTKDVDVELIAGREDAHRILVAATLFDLGDWFSFAVRPSAGQLPGPGEGGLRFHVTSRVDGRPFETFHIDVGIGDPVVEPVEYLTTPPLLAFADIPPSIVPCYPLSQHLAEKVHAYVRSRVSGESTRVKDLVDIVLLAERATMGALALRRALDATFATQGAGPAPSSLPAPPVVWAASFRKLAREVGLKYDTLDAAIAVARRFVDPVLSGSADGRWSPVSQSWQ
jgi:hypothetical protein